MTLRWVRYSPILSSFYRKETISNWWLMLAISTLLLICQITDGLYNQYKCYWIDLMEYLPPQVTWFRPKIRYLLQKTPRNKLVWLLVESNTCSNEDSTAYAVFQISLDESRQSILQKWQLRSKLPHLLMMSFFKQKSKMICGKIANPIFNAWDHQDW